MTRLPVGSLIWLYGPSAPPVEGVITGYVGESIRLQVHRRWNPTPLANPAHVYARIYDWKQLVGDMRTHADALLHAASVIEAECEYRKTEETP